MQKTTMRKNRRSTNSSSRWMASIGDFNTGVERIIAGLERKNRLLNPRERENRMAVLMGGRAAEHVVFSHFSTGAADDLAKIAGTAEGSRS